MADAASAARPYMLDFDLVADAWSLGDLIPNVACDAFRAGERLAAPADLRMPITTRGRALDITVPLERVLEHVAGAGFRPIRTTP